MGRILFIIESISNIFSRTCNASQRKVCQMRKSYLNLCKSIFVFFRQLREDIISMPIENRQTIIDKLSSVPKALCIEDIGDLFYLVEQHYVSRTPFAIQVS